MFQAVQIIKGYDLQKRSNYKIHNPPIWYNFDFEDRPS